MRPDDQNQPKRIVSQYNQVYLTLNEKGELLGWRLTKSTKFSEIEDLLQGIKQRLDSKDKTINVK